MSVMCNLLRLGQVAYDDAFALQQRLAHEVAAGSDGYLILLEHPHTYTLGRRAAESNVLASTEELARMGATVRRIDRGGDVTYHGPGQLVGYLIVNLHLLPGGVSGFVRNIESALIDALDRFGIAASTVSGRPGVWASDNKIAAIGLHVSCGITTHGFALNVDPDLAYFEQIVPCGLTDAGVTSMARLLGSAPPMPAVADAVSSALANRMGLTLAERAPSGVPV